MEPDPDLVIEARLAVLELILAESVARMIGDEAAMRDWTNRLADKVDRVATGNEDEIPDAVMAYTAAWDAMLANVRHYHAALRGSGGT